MFDFPIPLMELRAYLRHCVYFNSVKQLNKSSQIVLFFYLVIYSSVKYVLFLSPFCMLSMRKAIALSLFTILVAEIKLLQRQLFCKAVKEECCPRSKTAGAIGIERWKNDCRGNNAAVSILELLGGTSDANF